MNFIISIFLVLFLSISSCQREATGDIVPTPAARYGEVDLTFGESGQPWNLPDGTMRVINGRPDNVNIYIFNDALDYRKHAYYENTDMQPRLELPYGTYRIYALGNFGSDLGLLTEEQLQALPVTASFADRFPTGGLEYAVTREEFAVSQALSSLELRLTRPFCKITFTASISSSLSSDAYIVSMIPYNLPLRSSLWTDNRLLSTQGQFDFPYEKLTSKKRRHTLTYYQLENLQGTVPAIILPEDRNYRKAPRMATYVNIRICLNQAFYEYNIYIGQNDTSDFNVRRNTAYTYNVTILGTNPDDYRIAKTEYTFWGTKAGDKEYLNTFRWQNGTAQGVLVIVTEHCDPDNVLSLSFKRTSTGTYYPKWEMQYRTFGNAYRTWKEGERIEVHRNNGGSSVEIRFINSDGTTQYETTNNYFDFTLTDTRGFSDTFRVSTRKTT